MSYKEKLLKAISENGERGLKLLGEPQRIALNYAAQKLGVTGNPADSEESSRAIVEKVADTLGVPEDSKVGAAAKALGVAGLEVFGDPLSLIPGEKIAQQLGKSEKLANIVKKSPYTEKVINLLKEAYAQNKLDVNPETKAKVEKLIFGESFGNVTNKATKEAENLGKVEFKIPPEQKIGNVTNVAPEVGATTIGDKSGELTNLPAANAPITMDEIRRIKNNRGY